MELVSISDVAQKIGISKSLAVTMLGRGEFSEFVAGRKFKATKRFWKCCKGYLEIRIKSSKCNIYHQKEFLKRIENCQLQMALSI